MVPEQLEDAYQEALQHSLAVQAELLREEIADLQACQKPTASSKKKKSKEKKKRKKKEAAAAAAAAKENLKTQQKLQQQRQQQQAKKKAEPPVSKATKHPLEEEVEPATLLDDFEHGLASSDESPQDEIDREVEEFRILLEKINANCNMRKRKKLVLPPGAFASLASVGTMC